MALTTEEVKAVEEIVQRAVRAEIKELAREIAREVVAEQRRHELAAYDVTLDFDQMQKIQRAKMRELKRAKEGKK